VEQESILTNWICGVDVIFREVLTAGELAVTYEMQAVQQHSLKVGSLQCHEYRAGKGKAKPSAKERIPQHADELGEGRCLSYSSLFFHG
jgi:hypothetical protein